MNLNIIIDEIAPFLSTSTLENTGTKAFIAKYSKMDTVKVDWVDVCQDVESYSCSKYGFLIIVHLLKDDLYHGSHATMLYHNLSTYEKMIHQPRARFVDCMCGDLIEKQILYINEYPSRQSWFSSTYIDTANRFILESFEQHLNSINACGCWCPREIANVFGKSLGKYEGQIHSATDYTANTLFTQTNYYKQHFKDNHRLRTTGLKVVVNFYRWLVRVNPEHSYFENDFNMSDKLLFTVRFSDLLERDVYITTLNPANIPYGKELVCFIMKGFENESTCITNDDYVTIDFSGLTCTFYRDLLIEYIATSTRISAILRVSIPAFIREAMEKLYQVKQNPFYPNKKLDYLTNQEAIFIRQLFDSQEIGIRAKNNKIGTVRRFIAFCIDKKSITVDDLFFDYLTQYEEPNKNTAKTVPDDALTKLNKYLADKGKDALFYKEMFVLFHLAIQTEYRISQICHLQMRDFYSGYT